MANNTNNVNNFKPTCAKFDMLSNDPVASFLCDDELQAPTTPVHTRASAPRLRAID